MADKPFNDLENDLLVWMKKTLKPSMRYNPTIHNYLLDFYQQEGMGPSLQKVILDPNTPLAAVDNLYSYVSQFQDEDELGELFFYVVLSRFQKRIPTDIFNEAMKSNPEPLLKYLKGLDDSTLNILMNDISFGVEDSERLFGRFVKWEMANRYPSQFSEDEIEAINDLVTSSLNQAKQNKEAILTKVIPANIYLDLRNKDTASFQDFVKTLPLSKLHELEKTISIDNDLKTLLKPTINDNINQKEWELAEAFFKKNPDATKLSRKESKKGRDSVSSDFLAQHNLKEINNSFINVEIDGVKTIIKLTANKQYLGQGGFGDVKEGVTKAGDVYAVKIEATESIDKEERKSEQNLLSKFNMFKGYSERQLSSPRQFKFHSYEIEQKSYTVMRKIEGKNLFEAPRSQWSQQQKEMVFLMSVLAIHDLHSKDYIHRDIKPQNLMVTDSLMIELIDFGLTLKLNGKSTFEGPIKGSAIYMSPEANSGIYSRQSDIYALGVTLERLGVYPDLVAKMTRDKPEQRCSLSDVIQHIYTQMKSQDFPNMTDEHRKVLFSVMEKDPILKARAAEVNPHPPVAPGPSADSEPKQIVTKNREHIASALAKSNETQELTNKSADKIHKSR